MSKTNPYPFLSDPGEIPNTIPTEQQGNFRDAATVTARPQSAPLTANSAEFQPSNRNDIVGDMQSAPALNVQELPVVASGDMAAGGFERRVDRTPKVKGL